jgi:hypothetical protein
MAVFVNNLNYYPEFSLCNSFIPPWLNRKVDPYRKQTALKTDTNIISQEDTLQGKPFAQTAVRHLNHCAWRLNVFRIICAIQQHVLILCLGTLVYTSICFFSLVLYLSKILKYISWTVRIFAGFPVRLILYTVTHWAFVCILGLIYFTLALMALYARPYTYILGREYLHWL